MYTLYAKDLFGVKRRTLSLSRGALSCVGIDTALLHMVANIIMCQGISVVLPQASHGISSLHILPYSINQSSSHDFQQAVKSIR